MAVVVDAGASAPLPDDIDPHAARRAGLGATTADRALARLGDLESRLIAGTGAAGGAGSSAVAIAARMVAIVATHAEDS